MNNLTAYDEESDEDSPRRRSSEGKDRRRRSVEERSRSNSPITDADENSRQRKDSDAFDETEAMFYQGEGDHVSSDSGHSDGTSARFIEPPPPRRDVHSPSPALRTPITSNMPHFQALSQASLVSYGGDEEREEDTFERADREAEEADRRPDSTREYSPSIATEEKEPEPPARQSQDSDDEDERLIDQALEEGQNALKQAEEMNSMSPRYDSSPAEDTEIHDSVAEKEDDSVAVEVSIPPAPEEECDSGIQELFDNYFKKKEQGFDFNASIQNRKEFSNPSSYENLIQSFDIDEKGTNFRSSVFDPHIFPANCFYDKLNEEQRKMTEGPQKRKEPTSTTAPTAGPIVAKKAKP